MVTNGRYGVWVLIGRADRLLVGSGRPKASVKHYRRVWAAFGRFCDREGIVEPGPDHVSGFLIDNGADVHALTPWQRFKRRAVTCLFAIEETGAFPGPVGVRKKGVPVRWRGTRRHRWPGWTSSTRAMMLFFLREYLRFLVDRGVIDSAMGAMFPVIVANPEAVLPSVFTPGEVVGTSQTCG